MDQWETLQANCCVLFALSKKPLCVYFRPRRISAGTQAPRCLRGADLSLAVACGHSCPLVCGSEFPGQGSSLCLLRWTAEGSACSLSFPLVFVSLEATDLASALRPRPRISHFLGVLFGEKWCLKTNA